MGNITIRIIIFIFISYKAFYENHPAAYRSNLTGNTNTTRPVQGVKPFLESK